jgi:HEAT repeat protein
MSLCALFLTLCTAATPPTHTPPSPPTIWAPSARPASAGTDEDPLTASELLAQIRDKKDATPAGRYTQLAKLGTRESFLALKKALTHLRKDIPMQSACRAFKHFQGDAELEAEAIAFLADRTFSAQRKEEQRAAIHGLILFKKARVELEDILTRHRDGQVRTTAIRPLVQELASRNDRASLELLLDNARLKSFQRKPVAAALAGFPGQAHADLMLRRLQDPETGDDWKHLLLDALSPRPEDGITPALLRLAKGDDLALALHALRLIGERCLPGGADPPGKGTPGLIKSVLAFLKRQDAPALQVVAAPILANLYALEPDGPPTSWRNTVKKLRRSKETHRRRAACGALRAAGRPEDVDGLLELLDDREWSVRAAALQALTDLRLKRTLPALIEQLEGASGRTKKDVVRSLRLLTAEDHGTAAARWRSWWEAEGARFSLPTWEMAVAADEARLKRADSSSTKTNFYGMRVESRRVAFILDMSGSMNIKVKGSGESRRQVALGQVKNIVQGLSEGTVFNVVFFATSVYPWMDTAVALDKRTRAAALSFIDRQTLQGATNIYDALIFALEDKELDTIFVMSDGAPQGGPVNDVATIRAQISALNTARGVVIHGIAVGLRSSLLKGLAEDSGGSYREVL